MLRYISVFSIIAYCFATICRDGSVCPGRSTCCLTPTGVGCCPYTNAVCCGDGTWCCPNGYYCGYGQCLRSHDGPQLLFLPPNQRTEMIAKSFSEEDLDFLISHCIENQSDIINKCFYRHIYSQDECISTLQTMIMEQQFKNEKCKNLIVQLIDFLKFE